MNRVRLFSIQRSGSTYWEFLIINNYNVMINETDADRAQKHRKYEDVAVKEPCLLVVRNPVTWAPAFHVFSSKFSWYDPNKSFEEMLPTFAGMWNMMHVNWMPWCREVVKHEDVLEDPVGETARIASLLGWKRTTQEFKDTTRNICMTPQPGPAEFDRKTESLERQVELYPKAALASFVGLLDVSLLERFGYLEVLREAVG